MRAKKASGAAQERRYGQALDVFEKAVRAMGRKDFERARGHFQTLLKSHGELRDVAERARTFLRVCDRELGGRATPKPKTAEEMLAHGVYLHNLEAFDEAIKLFRRVAEQAPDNEHAAYCLAASLARSGDASGALQALRKALVVSPGSRAQARFDPDFDAIRSEPEFVSLTQPL
jgi:tetratricopeptide (TPR) repeat protein